MKDKLKNLELKKLLQEFNYLEIDKQFKDEFADTYKPLFLKEVQNQKTPEHKENEPIIPPQNDEIKQLHGIAYQAWEYKRISYPGNSLSKLLICKSLKYKETAR